MKNVLLTGGPGTGKTVTARAMSYYIGCRGQSIEDVFNNDFWLDKDAIENYVQSEYVEYIQLHPSTTYEDVVYGIEITSNGNLSIAYAEKRIKQLCDRAIGRKEQFFVILDDIGRTNPGKLLGNLLYALEYRNQPVTLADENALIIPDNVWFIITECKTLCDVSLEYAIYRRFDYEKNLGASWEVLDKYYLGIPGEIKSIVLNVFETINNFVTGNILKDSSIQVGNYLPGHGLLIVDRDGSYQEILERIQNKFKYQVWPYLKELNTAGIIVASDLLMNDFYSKVMAQLSAGQKTISDTVIVDKIFVGSQNSVPEFSIHDSINYCKTVVIPGGCHEHRYILESIVDAIFLNGVLTPEKALSDIFLNTNVVRFENRSVPGNYAAFMVDVSKNSNYGYQTRNSNHPRSYYSSNPCSTGRWRHYNDAPAYRVTFNNGITNTYVLLNALRNTGFTPSEVIHAEENAASIYCALYLLVKTYLQVYENEMFVKSSVNTAYTDLYNLVALEKLYWESKHVEIKSVTGADLKLQELTVACFRLQTLWNSVGTEINVDAIKFDNLVKTTGMITASNYEDLYNITGLTKSIKIGGANTMVNINDYQQIMDSIGVRQMIFQGPPGTSKTFESKKFVLEQLCSNSQIFDELNPSQETISDALETYRLTAADYANPEKSSKLKTGGWDLVQFHPSYGYEDFIRGIEVRPVNGTPVYETVNRLLGKIAEFAKLAEIAAGQEPVPKFYLIIDEINRANLATVFGELIYGLEYRDSKVSTPYEVNDRIVNETSKDIVLGKNLYIIGTMNTADKSIDAIDYAIRRRFIFIDSPASRDVVKSCYQGTMNVQDEKSIELFLFDAVGNVFDDDRFFNDDYQKNDVRIGHTYFLRHSKTNYIADITEKFVYQVIPILREYVKDGVLDSFEDKNVLEHSLEEIVDKSDCDKCKLFAEEIMLFVKYFGEKDSSGIIIDNHYITDYIENLCSMLGY